MKIVLRLLALPLLLLPTALNAQAADDAVMQSVRQLYEAGKSYVTATAEQSPEEELAFRPTAEVRTLGQVIGHLADAHYMICSIALGEASPATGSVEQAGLGKAEMVASLRRSYEYCDRAYAQSVSDLSAPAELFGQQTTRFHALNLNVSHDFEHYGNLVTYLRINGRVPPSSQASQ